MTRIFTIPYTKSLYADFAKPFRILVKELFFNKTSDLQPANGLKIKFLKKNF